MGNYITQREKTKRAMQAYLELMDTAEWLKSQARAPLESFDLTMGEFRVLELLNREGPLTIRDAARKRKASVPNLKQTNAYLERRGWTRRMIVTLPPVPFERSHKARSKESEPRKGQRLTALTLTDSGKRFIRDVLPGHSKFVKALFRVLDPREQTTMIRSCRKLRAGDAIKFLREIRVMDEEQEAVELRKQAMAELERLAARRRGPVFRGRRWVWS